MNFSARLSGFREFNQAMKDILEANTLKGVDKALTKGARVIYKEAIKNIRTMDIATADEFAEAMDIKKSKSLYRVKIGPRQSDLNEMKKVKWKGQDIPMVHWSEMGTKTGNIKSKFPVWKAYKSKKDEARKVTIDTLLDKISDIAARSRVLKMTRV